MGVCQSCGAALPVRVGRGQPRRFCSAACKQRAYRARRPAFPAEMTSRRAWVRADGKRPIMPDGSPASSTNPATWSTFRAVQSGAGDGFGIMLGGGLGCWDFDHCDDAEARALIRGHVWQPVVYVERSQSGRGVHVFVAADEGPGRRRPGVEFYSRSRFIRTTGKFFVI